MEFEIKTKDLVKTYRTFKKEEGLKGSLKSLFFRKKIIKTAVDSFDLTINKGEFLGLIGPNGAGKTTLIKMLSGIIEPDSGSVDVGGYIPYKRKDAFRKKIAVVMGQKSQLWWDLPACDTFLLNKEIYEIPDDIYKKNVGYFSELLGLKDLMNIQVRNLSLGERMKMELVSSLIHEPDILFLDEPTIGLDTVAQKQIRRFLKEVNQSGKVTILLTSHYMEDIKHLCNRIVVVRKGGKIYDGELKSLLDEYGNYRIITVSFESETELVSDNETEFIERNPYKYVIKVLKSRSKEMINRLMSEYEVDDIRIEEEDMADVVEKIYQSKEGV